MPSRAATATIKGYYYQFDKAILEILEASSVDTITVEHIEDVNLNRPDGITATQCKYIPSKSFSHSTIREAVVLMVADFVERQAASLPITYRLYAHFQDASQAPYQLSLNDLKEVLTYTEKSVKVVYHVDRGIGDDLLLLFLERFAIVSGKPFEDQQEDVLCAIERVFICSRTDADFLYYNNALRLVLNLSIQPTVALRTITRRDFLGRINRKTPLFNLWYSEIKGAREYCGLARRQISSSDALGARKERLIFLDQSYFGGNDAKDDAQRCATFIQRMQEQYFFPRKTHCADIPLTFVIDASPSMILDTKKELLSRHVIFNDGYEHIEFTPTLFSERPLLNLRRVGKRASDKIEKASYLVRLLSAETYSRHASRCFTPDSVLFISDQDPIRWFGDFPGLTFVSVRDLDRAFDILKK